MFIDQPRIILFPSFRYDNSAIPFANTGENKLSLFADRGIFVVEDE
jgi:hypothetical protein